MLLSEVTYVESSIMYKIKGMYNMLFIILLLFKLNHKGKEGHLVVGVSQDVK